MELSKLKFRENTWDNDIFNCVYIHNEYNLPEKLNENDVVIDIGAHIGSFTITCLDKGAGKVFAFEAFKDNFEVLSHNVLQFDPLKYKIFNKAVWRSDIESEKLYFTTEGGKNTGGGNVIFNNHGFEVDTIRFDDFLNDLKVNHNINSIKLLKLDCEGSEFPILLTCKNIGMFKEIVGEFHEINGEYDNNQVPETFKNLEHKKFTVNELQKFFEINGFMFNFVRDNINNLPCSLGKFKATKINK